MKLGKNLTQLRYREASSSDKPTPPKKTNAIIKLIDLSNTT